MPPPNGPRLYPPWPDYITWRCQNEHRIIARDYVAIRHTEALPGDDDWLTLANHITTDAQNLNEFLAAANVVVEQLDVTALPEPMQQANERLRAAIMEVNK